MNTKKHPLIRAVREVPGARAAWRRVWGRYNRVRSLTEDVRAGVRVATDAELARAYGGGAGAKPTARQVAENAVWAVRHGPNTFYYAYGMDRKAGEAYDQYLSVREMMRIIDRQIEEDGTEHAAAVLKDKYLFSLVAQALGHRSPRVLALLRPDGVDLLNPRRAATYEELVGGAAEGGAADGFAKLAGGEKGRGAFALRIEGGQAWVDGEPTDAAGLRARVGGRYLLQERVRQHPALAALHERSVNTVRLVTVLRDGRVEPLVAALRVGTGGVAVDNWSAGGLVVGLDLETGRLHGRGIFKPGCGGAARYGGFVDRHPDSDIALDGYALPDVPQAVELARLLHRDLGGPRTVGWDLAMTPDGPTVVEGNSHWSGAMYMAIDAGFKRRYFDAAGVPTD